jgi:hypothetical protein
MKEKGFEHLTSIVNKEGYRSVPLIRIAQRAGLFELLSQDLVQRQPGLGILSCPKTCNRSCFLFL